MGDINIKFSYIVAENAINFLFKIVIDDGKPIWN
jgi:hypothetical protein